MNRTRLLYCLVPLLLVACERPVETVTYTDPETGSTSWYVSDQVFSAQFIQLRPTYVAAFYEGRRLPRELVQQMAGLCVFGTIVRNEADHPVSYRVTEWRYRTADGAMHGIKPKSGWVQQWSEQGTAYSWSLLPDNQDFEVGDWNQGFTIIPEQPGAVVDFHLVWHYQGRTGKAVVKGAVCGEDSAGES